MPELRQTDTFRKWREALKDTKLRALIASRLDRLAFGNLGDIKPAGGEISELRIHYGAGYRIYFCRRGGELIILLCGGDKGSQSRDIAAAKRIASTGTTPMTDKTTPYDPAEDLHDGEAVEIFLNAAFETEDAAYVAHALGVVARAKGMTGVAKTTGLSREQLYKTLGPNGNPTLRTTLAVMKALGLGLSARANS